MTNCCAAPVITARTEAADRESLATLVIGQLHALARFQTAVGVSDLDLPEWLSVHSLSDLKRTLSEGLVLVLAIKCFERLLQSSGPDALYFAAAVALVSGVLVAFAALTPERPGPR